MEINNTADPHAVNRKLLIISLVSEDLRTIGSCYIFAAAKSQGIDVRLLYINVNDALNEQALATFLQDEQFGVIGIGLITQEYHFSVRLTEIIKRYAPNAFLFWGGVHPTCEPEECLQQVDCIVIGEGEESVPSIVNNYEKKSVLKMIDGVCLKLENGSIHMNRAAYIEDINKLPYPYYEFNGNYYISDAKSSVVRRLSTADYATYSKHGGDGYALITSRSCPNNCSYCINSFYNKLYHDRGRARFQRRRSVANTIEEIRHAVKTLPNIQFINFLDDHFMVGSEWLNEFIDLYGKDIRLPFMIRSTPEAITENTIQRLKEIGLKVVQMGIQSGCADTHREIFHRHFNRKKIIQAAQILHQSDVDGMYDFIIGNEFESTEAKRATIELMMELPKPFQASLFHIIPFPKTDIVQWYQNNGVSPKLDPYETDYLELDADFYTMLASIVPTTDNHIIQRLLDSIDTEECRKELKQRYTENNFS